jgi:hypothetical protein
MGLSRTLDMLKGSVCSSSWYQLAEDGGHAPQRRGAAPSLSKRGRPLGRFILQTQNGGRRRSCPGSAERARAGFQPGTAPRRLCLPKENGPRAGILARTPRFEASYGINSTTRRKAPARMELPSGCAPDSSHYECDASLSTLREQEKWSSHQDSHLDFELRTLASFCWTMRR